MEYKASPTLSKFHRDESFVRGVMGPIGSGKSVACTVELLRRALLMPPNSKGIRQSRFAVVRNSFPSLRDTTIKTVEQWIPTELAYFNRQELRMHFVFEHTDGTTIDTEWLFRALDTVQDVKKLLSLELTAAWINEAREIELAILQMLTGRVGRFPRKQDVGNYYSFVIMDTNPPDSTHWWYRLFEEAKPASWTLFKQPSGVSPEAENIDNLPDRYYEKMMPGKTQEWINVYVFGQYGFLADGRPVWPEYQDDMHHTDEEIYVSNEIVVGIDFGLDQSACFVQLSPSGQIQVIDELLTKDLGAVDFSLLLNEKCNTEYAGCSIEFVGDPAGEQRSQTDAMTPFQVLWNNGINAIPAPTNDFTIRREAVADRLRRLDFLGQPAFIVGPKAVMTRKALAGGYNYRRLQLSGLERYKDMPDKESPYSHIGDALQYAVLGLVGDRGVVGGFDSAELDYSNLNKAIV